MGYHHRIFSKDTVEIPRFPFFLAAVCSNALVITAFTCLQSLCPCLFCWVWNCQAGQVQYGIPDLLIVTRYVRSGSVKLETVVSTRNTWGIEIPPFQIPIRKNLQHTALFS